MAGDLTRKREGPQNALQDLDLPAKMARLAFHQVDDFDQPRFVPAIPVDIGYRARKDRAPTA